MRKGKVYSARGQEVDFDTLIDDASKKPTKQYATEVVRAAVEAPRKPIRGFIPAEPPPEAVPAVAARITITKKKREEAEVST